MNKKNIALVVVISVVLSVVMIFVNSNKKQEFIVVDKENNTKSEININQQDDEIQYEKNAPEIKNESVVVYISGEVKDPKVVEMKNGQRLVDAIEKCGGFTKDADKNRVNLALILKDEQQYIVPKIGEEVETVQNASTSVTDSGSKLVNINTADTSELKTLPGIGDKTAEKIIQYRERAGDFKSIEEIKNVGGIGDKKFEQIESQITV